MWHRTSLLLQRHLSSLRSRVKLSCPWKNYLTFARHNCEHLNISDKQGTSSSSRYLNARRSFNKDEITKDELIETTKKLGFVNVIDAFHGIRG